MFHSSLRTSSSGVCSSFFLLALSVLALGLAATPAEAAPFASTADEELNWLVQRDAFTQHTTASEVSVTSLAPPSAANRDVYTVGGGTITTFVGKTPSNVKLAKKAYVVLHGRDRNGATYWNILDSAYASARSSGVTSDADSIRFAPNFLSTDEDSSVRTGSLMGWSDPDAWVGGDAPTAPSGTSGNINAIFDAYLDALSDKSTYPDLETVVFVGHGAGAQGIQRYAALGKDSPRSGLSVRYVVANPSTNLYFTRDRPVPVDTSTCSWYNDYRYGLYDYESPYPLDGTASSLFKRYLTRDVRYLVGTADTSSTDGDQTCAGRAAGGTARRDRNYDYWAYLHLLAGKSSVPTYPGLYPALDTKSTKTRASGTYPTTSAATLAKFKTSTFNHQFAKVEGVGHSATAMLESSEGLSAIFGD